MCALTVNNPVALCRGVRKSAPRYQCISDSATATNTSTVKVREFLLESWSTWPGLVSQSATQTADNCWIFRTQFFAPRFVILSHRLFIVSQSATDMPPAPLTAAWSSEQLEWLEDQNAMYLLAYETNDLLEFWPSLFDIFFTLWPARSILWPIMPESQALTIEEQQSLFHAEEKYKLVSLFFYYCCMYM